MKTTAGIFLINSLKQVLLGHPTNAPLTKWSIPKGIVDEDEGHIDAAARELKEETGYTLSARQETLLNSLTPQIYPNKRKMLVAFWLLVEQSLDDYPFVCTSTVKHAVQDYPEIDQYRWVGLEEAKTLVHATQVKNINELLDILKLKSK